MTGMGAPLSGESADVLERGYLDWRTRAEAAERERDALREVATEAEQRLTQALGIIVEFGDLNGFRNCSDQDLGRAVQQMAVAGSATLDRLRDLLAQTAPVKP